MSSAITIPTGCRCCGQSGKAQCRQDGHRLMVHHLIGRKASQSSSSSASTSSSSSGRYHPTVIIPMPIQWRCVWPDKQTEERANGLPNQQSFSLMAQLFAPEKTVQGIYKGEGQW